VSSDDTQQTLAEDTQLYPFKWVWGLLGCVALLALVIVFGPYDEGFLLTQTREHIWYRWKLETRTTFGFVSAWGGYLLHQVFLWWVIFQAKRQQLQYVQGLHGINVLAITGNVFFVGLHLLQSKLWYDGLAQNISPVASQFSVIFLLVFVLIMENPRRGLIFGLKAPIASSVVQGLKRYHGYYFSWAITFTFWFHPFELTQGHLLGFFYIFALLLQSSLFFTRFHTNRRWTFFLEVYVLLHGTLVAVMIPEQGPRVVAMFGAGFLTLMVVTQIHGLGLSRRVLWSISLLYLATIVSLFALGLVGLAELLRIPLAEYGLAIAVAMLLWGLLKGWRLFRPVV